MNVYKLEGSFITNIKANSYNEAIDIFDNNIFDDNNLFNVDEIYIDYVTEYDKDGNEIEVYQ